MGKPRTRMKQRRGLTPAGKRNLERRQKTIAKNLVVSGISTKPPRIRRGLRERIRLDKIRLKKLHLVPKSLVEERFVSSNIFFSEMRRLNLPEGVGIKTEITANNRVRLSLEIKGKEIGRAEICLLKDSSGKLTAKYISIEELNRTKLDKGLSTSEQNSLIGAGKWPSALIDPISQAIFRAGYRVRVKRTLDQSKYRADIIGIKSEKGYWYYDPQTAGMHINLRK